MTYIDLINNFWKKNQVSPLSSTEIAFYFYLLKECDSLEWSNPFKLPTRKICFELDFRKDTITSVRNSLKQKGFIDFTKGDRRASDPEYSILDESGILVQITYQKPYQKAYQKPYQKAYQNTDQSPKNGQNSEKIGQNENPPIPPYKELMDSLKELSSDEDRQKVNIVGRSFMEKKRDFCDEADAYIPKYGQQMIDEFCEYWTKEVETDTLRFEKQNKFFMAGRLATWAKNSMTTQRSVTDIEYKTQLYNINWDKVKAWYVGLGLVLERWTDRRKRAYISVYDSYGNADAFREALKRFGQEVKKSDWILGLAGSPMRDFEWLFTLDNFALVVDGRYSKNYNLEKNGKRQRSATAAPEHSNEEYFAGF